MVLYSCREVLQLWLLPTRGCEVLMPALAQAVPTQGK